MPNTTPKGDGLLSRAHNLALREEIGERLRANLDLDPTDMPLHLQQLMNRFQSA